MLYLWFHSPPAFSRSLHQRRYDSLLSRLHAYIPSMSQQILQSLGLVWMLRSGLFFIFPIFSSSRVWIDIFTEYCFFWLLGVVCLHWFTYVNSHMCVNLYMGCVIHVCLRIMSKSGLQIGMKIAHIYSLVWSISFLSLSIIFLEHKMFRFASLVMNLTLI